MDFFHSNIKIFLCFLFESQGITSLSCSGFFIDQENGIILTSSSAFSPFFSVESAQPEMIKGSYIQIKREFQGDLDEGSKKWEEASFLGLIKIDRLIDSLDTLSLSHDWRMGWNQKGEEGRMEINQRNLIITWEQRNSNWGGNEYLAILALSNLLDSNKINLSQLILDSSKQLPRRSEELFIVSSPFGILSPQAFMNSLSQGIVCNIVNSAPSVPTLILTDAECYPGSEGSPVYYSNGMLAGVLLPPLYRVDGYSVELNLVLSWNVVLPHLLSFFSTQSTNNSNLTNQIHQEKTNKRKSAASVSKKSVVLLSVGSSWGSGVIITSKGHVLTSGHLISPFINKKSYKSEQILRPNCQEKIRIRIDYHKSLTWYEAQIIYLSTSHNDVALLQILDSKYNFTPVDFHFDPIYKRGQKVFAVGHGLWGNL